MGKPWNTTSTSSCVSRTPTLSQDQIKGQTLLAFLTRPHCTLHSLLTNLLFLSLALSAHDGCGAALYVRGFAQSFLQRQSRSVQWIQSESHLASQLRSCAAETKARWTADQFQQTSRQLLDHASRQDQCPAHASKHQEAGVARENGAAYLSFSGANSCCRCFNMRHLHQEHSEY